MRAESSLPYSQQAAICHDVISHINTIHALPSYLLKICFNIILPSMPGPSNCYLFFRFFSPVPWMYFSSLPHMLHMLTVSLLGILISMTIHLPSYSLQTNSQVIFLYIWILILRDNKGEGKYSGLICSEVSCEFLYVCANASAPSERFELNRLAIVWTWS